MEQDHVNKLWLIVKKTQIRQEQSNQFYLQGGERIKLGRVMIKILEVCSEQSQPAEDAENEDALTDSNKTNMSFRELEEPEGDEMVEDDDQIVNGGEQIQDLGEMRHTSIGGMRNTLALLQPATIVEEQKQEAPN